MLRLVSTALYMRRICSSFSTHFCSPYTQDPLLVSSSSSPAFKALYMRRICSSFSTHFCSPYTQYPLLVSSSPAFKGLKVQASTFFFTQFISIMPSFSLIEKQIDSANRVEQIGLLDAKHDAFDGVTVEMKEPMDSNVFSTLLKVSISQWRQQGKKGVWVKLPIQLAYLIEAAVKEGFWYHHAEATHLMLVYWIPETPHTIPANASHRVGIAAVVMNHNGEFLVVQEKSGAFKGTGVWKFPTGVVDQGEDICEGAIREVKEETGIDAEFVELLTFRQSHNSFFGKSDLMFVCMLKPLSSDIIKQDSELVSVQWMSAEEYAAQPFVQKREQFKYIADICLAKKANKYTGFSAVALTSGSSKKNYLYCNKWNQKL